MMYDVLTNKKTGGFVVARPSGFTWGVKDIELFDITKIDTLNSIPYYDYTFDAEMQWGILRGVYDTKLNRSLGFKGNNIKNERILLQSQFTEQRNINEENRNDNKGGFLSRLLGRK